MRWMWLGLMLAGAVTAAELAQLPAKRAGLWRITLDEDRNKALEHAGRRLITEGHIDEAYYTYHAVMRVEGGVRRFGGSERIGVNGAKLRADHAALKGEVLAFFDLVRYEFRNQHGAVSGDGKAMTEAVYEELFPLASGHVIVRQDTLEGALDAKLKPLVPLKYERLSYLGGGRFGGGLKGRFGVVDLQGKVVVPFVHETLSAHYLHGVHLIGSSRKNLTGVLNARGELVYPPRFKVVRRPDLAARRVFVMDTRTGEQGYINGDAEFVPDTAIKAYFREWRVATADPGRAIVYPLARARWEESIKRYKERLPPGKQPDKLHEFPAKADFKMELHLHANGKGSMHLGLSQGLLEWTEKAGALELNVHGVLHGRARVSLKDDRLHYQQLTRETRAGKPLENPLLQPVVFERKPPTLTGPAHTLELVYTERGPRDQARRMQFLRHREGGVSVDIMDETGIGHGQLRLVRGAWPTKMQLRLRLKGLEGIGVTIGNKTLDRAALNVRLCDPTGKPLDGKTLQNRPGYYEVTLPPAALKNAKEVRVNWVDFYR